MNRSQGSRIFSHIILGLAVVIMIIPILWLVVTSFKYFKDIVTSALRFVPNLDNYRSLFIENPDFLKMFGNSLIISVFSMFLCTILASLGAYSLTKMPWRKGVSGVLSTVLLSLEIIPAITIVIPLYMIGLNLGMIDTKLYVILVYSLFNIPFVYFLMSAYYKQIPTELEESGLIDGASRFTIFRKIILPLTIPILLTGSLFSFIFAWKEFLIGLSLTSTPASMTLNVKIAGFIQSYSVQYGEMTAAATLGAVPGIILCIFTQKYIVGGITSGSVKG